MFALAASPRKFAFMAKEELFRNPIYAGFWSTPMPLVSIGRTRAKRGQTPVKMLRQGELSVMISLPDRVTLTSSRVARP